MVYPLPDRVVLMFGMEKLPDGVGNAMRKIEITDKGRKHKNTPL